MHLFVVFTQLWFYRGNALCVWVLPPCVVPFTPALYRNKNQPTIISNHTFFSKLLLQLEWIPSWLQVNVSNLSLHIINEQMRRFKNLGELNGKTHLSCENLGVTFLNFFMWNVRSCLMLVPLRWGFSNYSHSEADAASSMLYLRFETSKLQGGHCVCPNLSESEFTWWDYLLWFIYTQCSV